MKGIPRLISRHLSRMLEPNEREAVLGDLEETRTGGWSGICEVAGLVVRRQFGPWRSWRSWAAAFGVAVPASFLLMGDSVLISLECASAVRARTPMFPSASGAILIVLSLQVLVLAGWSWTCGFFMGSVSRRTTWISVLYFGLPCLYCLQRFHIESLSIPKLCLFPFVLPAAAGLWRALRNPEIRPRTALALALGITFGSAVIEIWASPFPQRFLGWFVVSALTWPSWFLVAASQGTAAGIEVGGHPGLPSSPA